MYEIIWRFCQRVFGSPIVTEQAPRVVFYKEATPYGEHGKLVVDSPKYGLIGVSISFFVVGNKLPPRLTKGLIDSIWDQAETAGFVPDYIERYGSVLFAPAAMYTNLTKE